MKLLAYMMKIVIMIVTFGSLENETKTHNSESRGQEEAAVRDE